MENDQLLKELYDYLDGYDFVDESEVNCAVQEFFMEQNGYFEHSYSELLIIGTLADEYIKERNLFV